MREFIVKTVNGDYATLIDNDGEELLVAMALLPPEIDVGVKLAYENMEFSQ